ncbi:hypothetical protein RB614_03015 [Phytohabitans sp. ZYX-F-186]|uniref:Uncharacterized protein n=1 Tax=Phytohabitans maris TaxID=3071409 RepID=A0ABU0Z8U9_9ACTN|nr:hypothetical protein [Phytohabitans sp. ZYX-F-186]MDQ7903483.1 hypothetical protein [Phytohabitans sp. ZYX-F-186]
MTDAAQPPAEPSWTDMANPTPPRQRRRGLLAGVAVAVLVVAALGIGAVLGQADSDEPAATSVAASPRSSCSAYSVDANTGAVVCKAPGAADVINQAPSPVPSSASPLRAPVILECRLGDDLLATSSLEVPTDAKGRPDFTEVWQVKPKKYSCDAGIIIPETPLEKAAHATSKYDDLDIGTLYTICAEVDPTDPYAETGFKASPEQIREINAALTLCSNHPLAGKWRKSVQRGKVDADLEAQGRIFGAGTFLVGKEIKAGTYVTTDVDGCYWERQNRNGIIDNNFITAARRVQVTIRSTDYAFHSERCGEWRPA